MQNQSVDSLKYPIGTFERKERYTSEQRDNLIYIIEQAPARYNALVKEVDESSLNKTYREGSWNVRQLIHHVADIQLLHYFRMKKAITEPDYGEVTLINMDAWVQTYDGKEGPIMPSLEMLESITKRYVLQIRALTEKQLDIEYYHPVRKYTINQAQAIAMSAWHLEHHLAHIKIALTGK